MPKSNYSNEPVILQAHIFNIQVCVPKNYTDQQIIDFVESQYPAGTTNGWQIKRADKEYPEYIERVACEDRHEFVHIVLSV